MGFADHYLSKQQSVIRIPFESASRDLRYCIVIPCYNEDKLSVSLDSLWDCRRPESGVEVVIVVNSSESDTQAVINQNLKTIDEFKTWKTSHTDPALKFHLINVSNLPEKHAGA